MDTSPMLFLSLNSLVLTSVRNWRGSNLCAPGQTTVGSPAMTKRVDGMDCRTRQPTSASSIFFVALGPDRPGCRALGYVLLAIHRQVRRNRQRRRNSLADMQGYFSCTTRAINADLLSREHRVSGTQCRPLPHTAIVGGANPVPRVRRQPRTQELMLAKIAIAAQQSPVRSVRYVTNQREWNNVI